MTDPDEREPTGWVDPFIGVDGAGNCLPGPYLPLGLVRLSPDTLAPHATSGYRSADPIVRFSHTHVSGTGGMGRYGNIGVVPFTGRLRTAVEPYGRSAETAACGFYGVRLEPAGIDVELTATQRVGIHRYRFPAGVEANVQIDVGAIIQPHFWGPPLDFNGWQPESIGGTVEWISDREVVGRGDFRGGWGHGYSYSVHFYARFDRSAAVRAVADASGLGNGRLAADGPHLQALAGFGLGGEIGLRVGISYVSVAKARASVDREAGDASFAELRDRAVAAWGATLGGIRTSGGTPAQRTLFYTLFTRLLCMPSDLGVDDEFDRWQSGVRHFSDFYCVWDSVRNANSLIALVDPQLAADLVNCLLDVGGKVGWIPDAWIAGHSAFLQGGSSADILIAEAAAKGIPGIDYAKALERMRRNSEIESPDPYLYGRYLPHYRDLGFVSVRTPQCVSRHLEYAYQDWCASEVARHVGEADAAARLRASSCKVWNLWRDDVGSFAPRHADGRWVEPFDPALCRRDSWNDPYFYEGSGIEWSFNVQHDVAGLIRRFGGAERFVTHLDGFFERARHPAPADPNLAPLGRRDAYRSKETILHVPYLYIYAGRPDRTADAVRWAMERYFTTARNGLHDNEDMGCQSAFYMASAIGLYPVMGQDLYLLTTPVFAQSVTRLGRGGAELIIEAPGAGSDRPYIASATIDGRPLDRAWVRHREIASGATIRFELSASPTQWGRADLPPSPLAS